MKSFYSLLCWFIFGLLIVFVASGGFFAGWWSDTALILQFMSAILFFWVGRLTFPNRRLVLRFMEEYLAQVELHAEEEVELEACFDEEEAQDEDEDRQNRRRLRALEVMTNMAIIDGNNHRCRCIYCGRESELLHAYPHDPRLHLEGCIVPMARAVIDPSIALVPDKLIVQSVFNEVM